MNTGIDTNHEDLNIDILNFKSFVEDEKEIDNNNGHGTHIAGILGAKDNNIGVVGIVPGIPIIAIKVFGTSGRTETSTVLKELHHHGLKYKKEGGDVINLRFGKKLEENERVLDRAVIKLATKGIHVVIAARNEPQHAKNVSPGRVENHNVYTISACDQNDRLVDFIE